MKLSEATLDYILRVVNTADIVKMDSIIIEPNLVRATDDNHSVFILHTSQVPEMEFGSIGLTRINVFNSRFELGKTMSDFVVEAAVVGTEDNPQYARSLTMKAKGIKVEYRCANPTVIKSPRTLADPVLYRVELNPEAVLMMAKGQSAMSSEEVTFIGGKEGVFFEISDINSDKMTYKVADTVTKVDTSDEPIAFVHSYTIKLLLPLFKLIPTGWFYLTSEGIIKITINDLDIYILPRV